MMIVLFKKKPSHPKIRLRSHFNFPVNIVFFPNGLYNSQLNDDYNFSKKPPGIYDEPKILMKETDVSVLSEKIKFQRKEYISSLCTENVNYQIPLESLIPSLLDSQPTNQIIIVSLQMSSHQRKNSQWK